MLSSEMKRIIKETIHAGVTCLDPLLQGILIVKFGSWELPAGKSIEEIAKMIDIANQNE